MIPSYMDPAVSSTPTTPPPSFQILCYFHHLSVPYILPLLDIQACSAVPLYQLFMPNSCLFFWDELMKFF